MFTPNKYTTLYYNIIENAKKRTEYIKDIVYHKHHIVPKCMGGSNDVSNIVRLTYKEHRVCHRLLIKMTTGKARTNLSYAYSWFGKSAGTYRTGKDNNFSNPDIIAMVKNRMKESNPMKLEHNRERMRVKNNNPFCKKVYVNNIEFSSLNEAARYYNTTPHVIKRSIELKIDISIAKQTLERNTSIQVCGKVFLSKKHAQEYFKCTRKKLLKAIKENISPDKVLW